MVSDNSSCQTVKNKRGDKFVYSGKNSDGDDIYNTLVTKIIPDGLMTYILNKEFGEIKPGSKIIGVTRCEENKTTYILVEMMDKIKIGEMINEN